MFKMEFEKASNTINIEFVGKFALTPHQSLNFSKDHPWKIKIDKMTRIKYDDCCIFLTEPNSSVTMMYQPTSDLVADDWIHLIPATSN